MPSKAVPATKATEDLFPRGHSRGQPIVRKKQGVKNTPDNEEAVRRDPERGARRTLTEGATVLAVVTRSDAKAVTFELPSGHRARADPHETPSAGGASYFVDAVAAATGQHDAVEIEKDEEVPLYRVLRVGQVVRAAVITPPPNTGSKSLYLSLKPALINSRLSPSSLAVNGTHVYAAVKSVEDHGYVLDFGPIPTTGFLPFEDAPVVQSKSADKKRGATGELPSKNLGLDEENSESEDESEELNDEYLLPGAPIEVVVSQSEKSLGKKKGKKGKSGNSVLSSVKCSAKPHLVAKAESLMLKGLTFFGLAAGMRVSAKVQTVTAARVTLTLFGLFTVFVDSVHVPVGEDGEPKVKVGASMTVRLISVDPNQKVIMASLLPEVVNKFQIPAIPDECKIGVVVKNVEVKRIERNYGLYLKKYQNDNVNDEMVDDDAQSKLYNVPLFAHITRVSEKRIESLEKHFHVGKKLKCSARIVSVSKFDGVVNVDLRPSIIKRDVLDISEVKVGKCYNCKVISHHASGNMTVAVDGDQYIRGLITSNHVADTHISKQMLSRHPTLRVGGTVNCLATSVSPERGLVHLSARRSLVSPSHPLLLSYEQAEEAMLKYQKSRKSVTPPLFVGTVAKIFDQFILVVFCNSTKGSLEFRDLGLDEKEESHVSGKKRKKNAPAEPVVVRTQEEIADLYQIGQTIRVGVKGVDVQRKRMSLTLKIDGAKPKTEKVEEPSKPEKKKPEKASKIPVGEFFNGVVKNIHEGRGVTVTVPKNARHNSHQRTATGVLAMCDIDGDFDVVSTKMGKMSRSQTLRVRIVGLPEKGGYNSYWLSMRDPAASSKDPLITENDLPLKMGLKVRGIIQSVSKFGAMLVIGRNVRARVRLSDLANEYVENPELEFPSGKVVEGKICEAPDGKNYKNLVHMIIRTKEKKPGKSNAPKEGEVVDCTVKRVETFGAIVKLKSGGSALLHKSEADDDRRIENPHDEWKIGQELCAVVIVSNQKSLKISLKRSYFEAAGVDSDKIDEILEKNGQAGSDEPPVKKARTETEHAIMQGVEEKMLVDEHEEMSDSCDEEMDEAKVNDRSDEEKESENDEDEPVLNINHSLSEVKDAPVTTSSMMEDEDDTDDERESKPDKAVEEKESEKTEDPVVRKKQSAKEKRDKKRAKEAAQREIQQKEAALASSDRGPETAEDFERMLLAEPNSSAIWIRYMAFRLSLLQVDQARALAERALETIEMEKELEKVNVWMAYINLEANSNSTGAGNPALKAAAVFRVFDRAVKRVTDQLDFHIQVAASMRESNLEIAEEVMKRALKNFRLEKDVWIAAGKAKFEAGDAAAGRKLLERALMALEKRDHVAVIMKFSQFEYKYGSVEKGRTVFESLIGNYPKRLDVWNVFLDMETSVCRNAEENSQERADAIEATRLIFERCSCLDLSSKKAKSVFKKWISFERTYGDEEGKSYQAVLARAKQYVENKRSFAPDATADDDEA